MMCAEQMLYASIKVLLNSWMRCACYSSSSSRDSGHNNTMHDDAYTLRNTVQFPCWVMHSLTHKQHTTTISPSNQPLLCYYALLIKIHVPRCFILPLCIHSGARVPHSRHHPPTPPSPLLHKLRNQRGEEIREGQANRHWLL